MTDTRRNAQSPASSENSTLALPTSEKASEKGPESQPEGRIEAKPEALANWEDLGLSSASIDLVRKTGYVNPTAIQTQSIPIAMQGRDLICSSRTGSGKTASFALPMIERFIGREGTFGIVLAPTREIAQQIHQTFELFGAPCGIRSIVLIGGISMRLDDLAIATYPQIIVATPGRLCDHLDRGNIWLDFIQTVVLDEADRMLDMGFSDQLSRIMEEVPKERQTLLFSATIPPAVDALARRILRDPVRIAVGKPLGAAKTVDQRLVWTTEEGRNSALRRLLRDEPGSTMVFTRSKDMATRIYRSLHSSGFYDATYIHSDRLQAHREQALAEFKEGKYRILIATDVAGRGIHVDNVTHVINYELPLEPEDYVHRIGRTGRMDALGKATSLATRRDMTQLKRIEKLLGHPITVIGGEIPSAASPQEDRGAGRGRHGHEDRGRKTGRERRPPVKSAGPGVVSVKPVPVQSHKAAPISPLPQPKIAVAGPSSGDSQDTAEKPKRRGGQRGGRNRNRGPVGSGGPSGSGTPSGGAPSGGSFFPAD